MWSASRAAATPVERRAGSPARYSLSGMQQGRASRTAVLVCQGRAVADGLIAPGYFRDQIAVLLLSPEERAVVERARDDTPPSATRERLAWERMRACADGMVPRTVLIDDAVRGAGHRQLVIVGAGLDTRPWRLGELEDAVVFSVDHPASQADCRRRADGLGWTWRLAASSLCRSTSVGTTWPCAVGRRPRPIGADDVAVGRGRAVSDGGPGRGHARRTLGTLRPWQHSCRPLPGPLGDHAGRTTPERVRRPPSRSRDPLADELWRSLWTAKAIATLLGRHGFLVEQDEDFLRIASQIGSPTTHRRSLANGRVAIGTRVPGTALRPTSNRRRG
jgi:Leucine carboxyl methyltransferase